MNPNRDMHVVTTNNRGTAKPTRVSTCSKGLMLLTGPDALQSSLGLFNMPAGVIVDIDLQGRGMFHKNLRENPDHLSTRPILCVARCATGAQCALHTDRQLLFTEHGMSC